MPPYNALAIIALVLAFIVPPGGIVCGHIARKQIRVSREQGDGLALAGLILGYVFSAVIAVFVLIWLATLITTLFAFFAIFSQIPNHAVSMG